MPCKPRYGVNNVCGDLLFPGGADKTFWVGSVGELSIPFSRTQTGVITSIGFTAYNGLVRFEGQKFAHVFASEGIKGAGGNRAFTHRSTVKLLTLSTQDDVEVQSLIQMDDAFIVYRDNNDQFFISGYGSGLSYAPGPLQSTGQAAGDDVTDTIIMEGVEKTKPLRFLVTDVATTIAYLNARVI